MYKGAIYRMRYDKPVRDKFPILFLIRDYMKPNGRHIGGINFNYIPAGFKRFFSVWIVTMAKMYALGNFGRGIEPDSNTIIDVMRGDNRLQAIMRFAYRTYIIPPMQDFPLMSLGISVNKHVERNLSPMEVNLGNSYPWTRFINEEINKIIEGQIGDISQSEQENE